MRMFDYKIDMMMIMMMIIINDDHDVGVTHDSYCDDNDDDYISYLSIK